MQHLLPLILLILLASSHSTPLHHVDAYSSSPQHPHHTSFHSSSSSSPHSSPLSYHSSKQQLDFHDPPSIVHHLMSPFTDIWKLISSEDGSGNEHALPIQLSTSTILNLQPGKQKKEKIQQQQPSHHSPRHTSTRFDTPTADVSLDNPPPVNLPPARLFIPLTPLSDGTHWAMTLYVGGSPSNSSNPNSTALQPGSTSSRPMLFVLDTGSSDIVVFNRTHCYGNGTAPCYTSTSYTPLNIYGVPKFGITIDDETFLSNETGLLLAQDLFTLQVNVGDQTNQTTYRTNEVQFYVQINETMMYIYPSPYTNSTTISNKEYYYGVAGVIGLGPLTASQVSNSYPWSTTTGFLSILNESTPILGLNLAENELSLDGIDTEWLPRLVWNGTGNVPELTVYNSYIFHMYHLTLCGVDLFANLTTSWHALVDTGSSCLGLPAEFYDSLMAWLPLKCNLGYGDSLPHVCYLDSETIPILPTISFQLSDGGTPLYISLTDLLFPFDSLTHRLCLTRANSILIPNIRDNFASNMITFGTRVVKQFYMAIQGQEQRLGFANIQPNLTASSTQCAPRVVCTGMQVHYEQLNMCLPPPCSDFFFFELDSAGTSCVLQSSFHITAGLLIAIFILAELGLNEMVIYLGKKVRQNALAAGGAAPAAS